MTRAQNLFFVAAPLFRSLDDLEAFFIPVAMLGVQRRELWRVTKS
jgi:hypothetical protein